MTEVWVLHEVDHDECDAHVIGVWSERGPALEEMRATAESIRETEYEVDEFVAEVLEEVDEDLFTVDLVDQYEIYLTLQRFEIR